MGLPEWVKVEMRANGRTEEWINDAEEKGAKCAERAEVLFELTRDVSGVEAYIVLCAMRDSGSKLDPNEMFVLEMADRIIDAVIENRKLQNERNN